MGVGDDESSTKPPPPVLHPAPDMDTVEEDGTSKVPPPPVLHPAPDMDTVEEDGTSKVPPPPVLHPAPDMDTVEEDGTSKVPPPPVLHPAPDMDTVEEDGTSKVPPPPVLHPAPDMDTVEEDGTSKVPPPPVLHPALDMDTIEDDGTSSTFLPHELTVSEILVRLPVKSLMRFKCVSQAWHDSISSDASFSEAHTRRLLRQNGRPSSLLMAPFIRRFDRDGDLVDELAVPGLWLWDENQRKHGVAALLHEMDWFAAEDREQRRLSIAHCDGLIMLADPEGTVRVLNPATRRSLTLPPIPVRSRRFAREGHKAFGFGRDLRSGFYKVAHFFKRDSGRLGMEVFTIGEDDSWRDIDAEPPHPFLPGRTAVLFNGTLVWTVDLYASQFSTDARFIRFSLDDESFTAMDAPQWYSWLGYEQSMLTILAELHGELGLVRVNGDSQEIWVCDDIDYRPYLSFCEGHPLWIRHDVLDFADYRVHPVAAFEDGIVFRDTRYYFGQLTKEGSKNLFAMNGLHYRDPAGRYSGLKFDAIDVVAYTPTLASV
ncbi:hypothetical protein ACQ4PT_058941 [Festuca glaucescens]